MRPLRGRGLAAIGLVLLLAASAWSQAPPTPTRWVSDRADFLSPGARASLDARLEQYQHATGHQVLVWIDRSTGGVPLEDFTIRAVTAWKVGRKGLDDGLVLFLFSDDRRARIEVGYGLEGVVPDLIASRVIREILVPGISAGDRDGAVTRSVDALVAAIDRDGSAPPPPTTPVAAPPSPLTIGLAILFLILLAAFAITHPRLAFYLFLEILRGAGRGGRSFGGSGGGGFSGGGGRFGGGGASGSW